MDTLVALVIVFAVYAIGDIISYYTKSIVSMLFTASVLFIILFWMGLPATVFEDANLLNFGAMMIGLLIVHMGSLLSLDDFIKQWKTVVIAVFAMAGIGVLLFVVGPILVDRLYAIAAAPPIAGGVVAAIIMGERAFELGMPEVQVFVTIIVAVQGFVGYPICSIILNKEAKTILSRSVSSDDEVVIKERKPLIPPLNKDLQTAYVLLLKLAVLALISSRIAALTNGVIHNYVVCLFIGVFARAIGLLEPSTMTAANSFGIAMAALMAVIFSPLSNATPEVLSSLIYPLVVTLVLGTIGIFIFSTIGAKIFKMSVPMAIAIGVTALFGFPGTFVLSNEVAVANGKTEEERKRILDEILPKMLVAGFATVTVGSVIMAGIMVKML